MVCAPYPPPGFAKPTRISSRERSWDLEDEVARQDRRTRTIHRVLIPNPETARRRARSLEGWRSADDRRRGATTSRWGASRRTAPLRDGRRADPANLERSLSVGRT